MRYEFWQKKTLIHRPSCELKWRHTSQRWRWWVLVGVICAYYIMSLKRCYTYPPNTLQTLCWGQGAHTVPQPETSITPKHVPSQGLSRTPISFWGTLCLHYVLRCPNDLMEENAIIFLVCQGPLALLVYLHHFRQNDLLFSSNGLCHGRDKFEYCHSQIMWFCSIRETSS